MDYLKRLKNTGTVLAVTGFGIIIAQNFGLQFDSEVVNSTITAVCGIGVALGIMNNPTTPKLDMPSDKK